MRRCFRLAIFLVLFVASLSAQTTNLYGGYLFLSNDLHITKILGEIGDVTSNGRGSLNGWNISGEIKVIRWIGAVADFAGSYGSDPIALGSGIVPPGTRLPTRINTSFYSYLFGPRLSVEVRKIRPFAEVLVGTASQSLDLDFVNAGLTIRDSEHDTHLATAFGGGFDYRVIGPLEWRVEADYVASRLFKGVQPGFSTPVQHNVRLSTGIVIRF
jgi:hypothetical protein